MGRFRGHGRLTVVFVIAAVYALALTGVAAGVLIEYLTGTGSIGHKHMHGRAAGGVIELAIVLLLAAGLLVAGCGQIVRHKRATLITWPLGIFVIVGCIGEIVDLFGSASTASDAIGAGLIALATIPVALILRPQPKTRGTAGVS